MMDFGGFLNKVIVEGLEYFGRYYGEYYGWVVGIQDPNEMGSLLINCPEAWGIHVRPRPALSKGVFAGEGYGSQVLPQVGDRVSVTFRHGDPLFPLWQHSGFTDQGKPEDFKELDTYGFITPGGTKVLLKDSIPSISVYTPSGQSIIVDDETGSIKLETKDGVKLTLTDSDIKVGEEHSVKGDILKDILSDLIDTLTTSPLLTDQGPMNQATAQLLDLIKDRLEQILTKY